MKLHFHGSTYEEKHTELDITEGNIGGRYRGTPWKIHHLARRQQRRNETSQLKYRGIPYVKE